MSGWWWAGDLKGCRVGFLGRKSYLGFREDLRTVERLRGQLFRKEISSLK